MRGKSKISGMLPKSFKAEKCKTSLKLAMARIKLLKNKREVLLKQMRRDVAQLLESGQEQTARIRVEHVIREEKTMSAYELIEIYCELTVARLPIIESQKNCPIDLKEAVASIIFASPRCADIPELMEIQKHFVAKYGKEFTTAALEVRPGCGVSHMMVEKLSARAPDVETKIMTLTAIAQEHNVKWDPKALQEQIKKPNDDLLNGPTSFISTGKMSMESSSVNPGQPIESVRQMPENVVTSKQNNFNLSHENINTPGAAAPFNVQSTPKTSENSSGAEEFKVSYSKEDSALNQSNWNMEFKDATSAAQAAAESAERASRAARAAAELASRGNVSRQNSSGSLESTVHDLGAAPGTSKGSRLKDERPVRESATMKESERKSFQGMKLEMHKPQAVEATAMRDADYVYGGRGAVGNKSPRSPSHSGTSSIYDDVSEFSLREADLETYSYTPNMFSEAGHRVQHQNNEKIEHADVGLGNVNESKSTSSQHGNAFDGDTIWDNPENTRVGDYHAAVFDDYGSDTDDHSIPGGHSKGNLLDSFMRQESSSFSSNMEPWSPKQQKRKSLVTDVRSPFVTEPHATEYSETVTKDNLPSQSTENMAPAYDSDGLSSEDDYEMDQSASTEAMKPNNLLQKGSTKGSPSTRSKHETAYFDGKKDVEGAKKDSPSSYSNLNEKNYEAQPSSSNKYRKSSGFSELSNQPSIRYDKRNPNDSMRGSDISPAEEEPESWRSPRAPSMVEAETTDKFGMPSSPSGTKDSELPDDSFESGQSLNLGRLTGGFKNRGYRRPPYVRSPLVGASLPLEQASDDSPSIIEKPVVSGMDDSPASTEVPLQRQDRKDNKESNLRSAVTNFSRDCNEKEHHAVGSGRHRVSSSTAPEGPDFSPITVKSTVSHPRKTALGSEVPKQEMYDQKPHIKAYTESSSSMPMDYIDSDNNDKEDLRSRNTVGRKGTIDAKLSRRTRDMPSKGSNGSRSRTINQSEMATVSDVENNKVSQSSSYATEFFSNTGSHARNLDGKEGSKFLQPGSSAGQSSATSLRTESSMFKGSPKSSHNDSAQPLVPDDGANSQTSSSSRESSSHGSSRQNASHVHPKLPDYDSIISHFQSLRSNRA